MTTPRISRALLLFTSTALFFLVSFSSNLIMTPVCLADEGQALIAPTWTVPAGWQKLNEERPMRFATFRAGADATAIEIVVSTFPGQAGGILANANRWRGQVGLEKFTEDQLADNIETFENPGFIGQIMRFEGAANHVLGAMIHDEKQDRMWFVKATASPTAIDKHKADIVEFAKSFSQGK